MIFCRVGAAMDAPWRKARETVMAETPARRATSDIVGAVMRLVGLPPPLGAIRADLVSDLLSLT